MKKAIAILLVIFSLAMLFTGCAKEENETVVLPVQDVADTPENRVKAMVETSLAYYRKNPYVQYDYLILCAAGHKLGTRNAAKDLQTPEMATPQRNTYQNCSFHVYTVTYHSFDYEINGGWPGKGIEQMAKKTEEAADNVFQFSNPAAYSAESMAAMEEFKATLQPGDLVYYTRAIHGTTHALMWAGDIDGDGDNDILNVDGSYYDKSLGLDIRENGSKKNHFGGVDINSDNFYCPSGEYFFFNEKAYDYFPKLEHVGIVRYWDKPEKYPLSERAKTRLLYPGMNIFYTVEGGIYGAVNKGGELTYTLEIQNTSQQDYEGLLVQIPAPKNGKIVKVNGEAFKGNLLKMTWDIPAGGKMVCPITVQATGNVGDLLTAEGAYVHAIPLPTYYTGIQSAKPEAAAVRAAMEKHVDKTGVEFLNAVGGELGMTVTVPALKDLQSALYKTKNLGDVKAFSPLAAEEIDDANKALAKMQVKDWFGGQYVATSSECLRVKECLARDLQAGDMVIWEELKGLGDVAIHDGENLCRPIDGKLVPMTQDDLDHFLMYRYFIALRPTQAQ